MMEHGVEITTMMADHLMKKLGKSMDGKVICPLCSQREMGVQREQELSCYGDRENILFCPHCELEVKLDCLYLE